LTDFMQSCFGYDSHDRKYGYDVVTSGTKPKKITTGSFGLQMIPNLIRLDFDKYPVLTAAYEVVVNGANGEEMIIRIQDKLARH
ncbi:MAG: glycerol-3-phosphate acyltransferase, partial [Leptospiraceae bacterium]|nr:glycerol-3-phosphate acyltransferase [Leptospiraceae bacterium]